MAYPTNYGGRLNANEIFNSVFNMIIGQVVFGDNIKGTKSSLVDAARVDGTLHGDTKLYYATDVLRSYAWGNDAEATKLLELDRPEDPQCQAITVDVFRQIRLTVDNYLTKRAWMNEGAFTEFNNVMLGWLRETKKVYDATTYNTFIGTYETSEGKQNQTVTLPTVTGDQEAQNRLQAQTIATKVADLLVDLEDISRDYNDYQNLRSYSSDDFRYIWNASFVNKINKLDLPTIFHKDFIDKFAEYTLPAKYFGTPVAVTGTAINSDGTSYRMMQEGDVTLENSYTFKGKTLAKGSKLHLFAGDLIPNGVKLASTTEILVPSYKEDNTIVCKIVHKDAVPYMSSFEAGTSFLNSRSLSTNHYLTFAHNTLEALHDKPFVTLRATEG